MKKRDYKFSIIPLDAAKDARLSKNDYRVLISIYHHANNGDACWRIKCSAIAEETGLPISRVSEITTRLQRFGWIKKDGHGGRSKPNTYLINPNTIHETFTETVKDTEVVKDTETVNVKPETFTETVCKTFTETVRGIELNIEQTKDTNPPPIVPPPPKTPKPEKQEFVLPGWLPSNVWESYLDHRKSMKSRMTDKAQELAIKKLSRMRDAGHDPVEVIEQSIEQGWKGLFEVKKAIRHENDCQSSRKLSAIERAQAATRRIEERERREREANARDVQGQRLDSEDDGPVLGKDDFDLWPQVVQFARRSGR